ncbi:MAG: exo-alpha-sialidase [Planctomycetaceae bacterium]
MSDSLLLATRKGLFTVKQTRGQWTLDRLDFLGQTVNMLLDDPRDGALYAGLALGHFGYKLHRSDDRGRTWNEVAVPVYPEGAEYGAGPMVADGDPKTKPASLKEIWALEAGGPDQPGLLWAGTIPGGLFCSRDRGESWELVTSLWDRPERMEWFGGGKDDPGIHSICVDPRDSRHVTIAISCGGVWETTDAGESWSIIGQGLRADFMPPDMQYHPNTQDAHRLAQSLANPDHMWVQHHNGIFVSRDGAKSFQEIEQAGPSVFGFAVCAHPQEPDTAWFVPAIKDEFRIPVDGQLVVTRTRDGGQSFETLRNGLPQQHCYDLVFRHGLDVDGTGQKLAMGSSTGGLWITDDGGDRWTEVSTTLPQIYCVRFVREQ